MRLDEHSRILLSYAELVPAVMSRDAYDIALRRNRLQTTCRGGRGRFVEVVFDSMTSRYQSKVCEALGDPREVLGLIPRSAARPYDRVPFNELTPKEMTLCNAKYNLVKCMRQYVELHGGETGLTAAKAEFVKLVQGGFLCPDSYKIVGRLSAKTLYRWDMEMRRGGDIMDALAPLRAPKRGSCLAPEHRKTLIEIYCRSEKPNYAITYRTACRVWKMDDIEIPEATTCRRFLIDWERENGSVAAFHRKGLKYTKEHCLPSLQRNPESLNFLDVLVSDGRVLNMQVVNPDTGKLCRPTLVAWIDMRTLLVLGFELMVTENTKSVVSSFRNACLRAASLQGADGAILPRAVYMDNGRAFKNKALNAKADLSSELGGLFERLKPYGLEEVHYAKAYNARAKVIERIWPALDEVEQMASTYVGNSIDNKPASLHRNELWHREQRERAIAKSGYPTLWGAYRIIEWFIEEYNNRAGGGKYLKGNSPMELAAKEAGGMDFASRILRGRELDYMIMHQSTRKLTPNGFKINGVFYYNPMFRNLCLSGEEYIVKFSYLDESRILVYRENGTFLCEAGVYFGQNLHGFAKFGSDADQSKVKRAQIAQKALEDMTIKEAVGFRSGHVDISKASELYASAQLPEASSPLPISGESIDTGDNLQIF